MDYRNRNAARAYAAHVYADAHDLAPDAADVLMAHQKLECPQSTEVETRKHEKRIHELKRKSRRLHLEALCLKTPSKYACLKDAAARRRAIRTVSRERAACLREVAALRRAIRLRLAMDQEFAEYMALVHNAEFCQRLSGLAAVWRKRGAHEAWPRRVHAALLAAAQVLEEDGDHAIAWRVTRFLL